MKINKKNKSFVSVKMNFVCFIVLGIVDKGQQGDLADSSAKVFGSSLRYKAKITPFASRNGCFFQDMFVLKTFWCNLLKKWTIPPWALFGPPLKCRVH